MERIGDRQPMPPHERLRCITLGLGIISFADLAGDPDDPMVQGGPPLGVGGPGHGKVGDQ